MVTTSRVIKRSLCAFALAASLAVVNQGSAHAGDIDMYRSMGTQRCLDGDGAGDVYTSPCNQNNPYQHWTTRLAGNGYDWQWVSVGTGRCLDGNGAGQIYTSPCSSTNPYQAWTHYPSDIDQASGIYNRTTQRVIDGDGSGAVYASIPNSPPLTNPYQIWA